MQSVGSSRSLRRSRCQHRIWIAVDFGGVGCGGSDSRQGATSLSSRGGSALRRMGCPGWPCGRGSTRAGPGLLAGDETSLVPSDRRCLVRYRRHASGGYRRRADLSSEGAGSPPASSGNPYLALGGLTQPRDVVVRSVNAQATYLEICAAAGDASYEAMRKELCAAHPGITYEVTPDFNSNAPVILVTVKANTPQNAITSLNVLMNRIPSSLATLQGGLGLRPNADITTKPIQADTVPQIVRKDQIRAGVVAGGGLLALGLLLIGLLDGWLSSLAGRRLVAKTAAIPDWSWSSDVNAGPKPPTVARSTQAVDGANGWHKATPHLDVEGPVASVNEDEPIADHTAPRAISRSR